MHIFPMLTKSLQKGDKRMRSLHDYMMKHQNEIVSYNHYSFQIYMDGKNGNIHKPDGTLLVGIFFDDTNFKFYFAKKNEPYEWGYDGYFVAKSEDISSIFGISHADAKKLYEVICGLIG